MTIYFKRQYGADGTLSFPLRSASSGDFVGTATHASGDIAISMDGGTATTFTGSFAAIPGGVTYAIAYTGTTHLQAKQVVLEVVDQSDPKIWLDEYLCVETEGNENAQHLDRTNGVLLATTVASVSDAANFVITDKPNDNNTLLNGVCLLIDNSSPDTPPDRSFRNVISYTGSTGAVQLASNAEFTPAAGDLAIFFPASDVATAAEIAAAVAAFTLSGETTAGSLSQTLTDIVADVAAVQSQADDNGDAIGTVDTVVDAILADTELILADGEGILADTENAITERAGILADTEAVLTDSEAAATSLSSLLTDTEATQTAQTSILADTEAVLADTEGAGAIASILTDTEAVLADTEAAGVLLNGVVIAQGTIGATGNDTTHVHLAGLTYGDDEIIGYFLVIFDNSTSEYHVRDVTDWADTGDLATVTTLPFTPEASVDTYWLLSAQAGAAADTAAILVDTEAIISDTEASQTAETAILVDTEASQTAEASILSDTEQAIADTATIIVDTEAAVADTETVLVDSEAILADSEAILADTELWDSAQSEPTGVPTANAAPLTKLGVLYLMARNKIEVTASKKTYYGDDDSAEFEKDLSDDGTTYQETKLNAI